MEGWGGGIDPDAKTPFLPPSLGDKTGQDNGNDARAKANSANFNNSVSALRHEFFLRLPDKVRSGLDPESLFHLNHSKTTGMVEGNLSVSGLWEKQCYERQFATLRLFKEVDNILQAQHESALKISNWDNPVLARIQDICHRQVWLHSITASTPDSLLDLMAGGILWFTHLSMETIDIYKYPIGKLRVQPVGIIIFAAIMATLGIQVLVQAVEQLIRNQSSKRRTSEQLVWLYTIILTATGVKLILWIICRSSGNKIVRLYEKDHYFDAVTNVVGSVAAVLGDKFYWWIDPVGAISLTVFTISNWSGTVLENVALRHHPQINCVDTVRAYTFGVLYFVELSKIWVDIELPKDLPLKEAHGIGESLQVKIEELPEVERAFVYLD
ncbi:hypothetical protein NL676_001763 [Syzygium grande]|nr:hypothetical protein NL676_001763 [Syzygium grande]